jgi:membrane-associated protease RseP (regulator of RpoE activity)
VRDLMSDVRKGDIHRGRLGVEIRTEPAVARLVLGAPDKDGVLVATVEKDGPADRAGLEPGDVIVSINGETLPPRRLRSWLLSSRSDKLWISTARGARSASARLSCRWCSRRLLGVRAAPRNSNSLGRNPHRPLEFPPLSASARLGP